MEPAPASPTNVESPPLRQTILGSFLRGRRHSNSHLNPPLSPTESPPPPFGAPRPPSPNNGHRRRPATAATAQSPAPAAPPTPVATTPSSSGAFSGMLALRRRRSGGNIAASPQPSSTSPVLPSLAPISRAVTHQPSSATPVAAAAAGTPSTPAAAPSGPAHRIRLVPHLESRRSLRFDPISRDVREGDVALRIGRFTDRSGSGATAANALSSNKLAFKSKVVSRTHAEVWVEHGGRFLIKDTKSSSGTFLNHVRLSPANAESKPHELRDGDILQLGVDYQGGTEDIYKCVKIRVEVGREWQAQANAFNTNALKQLKSLAVDLSKSKDAVTLGKKPSTKTGLPDCCICLFSVSIQQALFIAPCSHAFHYKCLRPLLDTHYPAFVCPLCRTFADLEADVEVDELEDADADADIDAELPGSGDDEDGAINPVLKGSAIAAGVTSSTGATLTPAAARRARDREDALGAETEVEPDTGASRLGTGVGIRRNPHPRAVSGAGANGGAGARHQLDLSHLHEEEEDDGRSGGSGSTGRGTPNEADMAVDADGYAYGAHGGDAMDEDAAMALIAAGGPGAHAHAHAHAHVNANGGSPLPSLDEENDDFLAAVHAMDALEASAAAERAAGAGVGSRAMSVDVGYGGYGAGEGSSEGEASAGSAVEGAGAPGAGGAEAVVGKRKR